MPGIVETAKEEKSFVWKEALEETPPKNILDKINLNPGPLNIIINIMAISLIKLLVKVFFFLKVEGRENLPKNGPYLICPNHTNYLDGLLILSALPFKEARKTYFVGYSVIFEHYLIRWLIKLARLIPLEVSFNLVEALRACSYVLRHSKSVCYFPEGQRSIDGEVKEFKKGAGILINEQNIPVVPVYIDGAFRAWPRYRKFPRPRKIKIKIGKALTPEKFKQGASKKEDVFEAIVKKLRSEVVNLQQSG